MDLDAGYQQYDEAQRRRREVRALDDAGLVALARGVFPEEPCGPRVEVVAGVADVSRVVVSNVATLDFARKSALSRALMTSDIAVVPSGPVVTVTARVRP